jgi:signal peptidase I
VDKLFETEKLTLFEDILDRGLILSIRVTGSSMSPFLAGEEILKIQKVPASSLQIGDLIFYKTREGFPLLHRIVRKQREKDMFVFQTKGDALITVDKPTTEHDILGKVRGIEKSLAGGTTKRINMESPYWRSINYLLAVMSLGKLKIHYISVRNSLYYSCRCVIKKVFM